MVITTPIQMAVTPILDVFKEEMSKMKENAVTNCRDVEK